MKKTLIALLAVALLISCTAEGTIDTSAWKTINLNDIGMSIKLPDTFEEYELSAEQIEDGIVYEAADSDLLFQASIMEGITDVESLEESYSEMEVVGSTTVKNIAGVDTVLWEGTEDYVTGAAMIGSDGYVYQFFFAPLVNEDESGDPTIGRQKAVAIISSLTPIT